MKIHVLAENKVNKGGLLAQHGLSLLIEHENTNILFDTGSSDVYLRNASIIGIDMQNIDFIVLSHGHYDHCGGLIYYKTANAFPEIYVHEKAFVKRYHKDAMGIREIGIPWCIEDYPEIKKNLCPVRKTIIIKPNITLVGETTGDVDFEEISADLISQDEENMQPGTFKPDLFMDELILVIETSKGLVLFLGCSHPGIISCINHIKEIFKDKKIHMLIAGMHLDNAAPERIHKTIECLREKDIQRIAPLHCTGILAIAEMRRCLGERCEVLYAGDTFVV